MVGARSQPLGGWTLVELMVASALVGLLVLVGPTLLSHVTRGTRAVKELGENSRELRVCLQNITKALRSGVAGSVVVDAAPGQPPLSRLACNDPGGMSVRLWQDGRRLVVSRGGAERELTNRLGRLVFAYPDEGVAAVMTVSVSLSGTASPGAEATALYGEVVLVFQN